MAPSGDAYNVDWIISTTSNAHVANDRGWFTSFTPFETYCGHLYSLIKVAGIGTVQLNVKLHKQKRGRQINSRIITLDNVLYVPSSVCNIFGLPSSSDYAIQLDRNGGMVTDKAGNRAGRIEMSKLPRLRLHGQSARQSSLSHAEYVINARWPDTERARWNAHQAELQSVPVIPYNGDAPAYSTDEKVWLKKHYGSEFDFLRSLGFSIYKEEDRVYGRSIVREWMMDDGGEPKGSGS